MIPAILMHDAYKASHIFQYPPNTTKVYSNLTPRISRIKGVDHVVVFGIQYFVRDYLGRRWQEGFFRRPKSEVVGRYKRRMDNSLGKDAISMSHIEALHDLGYLPIHLKALPEGTLCPLRVPVLTITNTHPDFGWLPNFLETILSNVLWHPMTSATIAYEYRKILSKYAQETSDVPEFVQWQGHDFSMRGHSSFESSLVSGGAHLTSFTGTDTIPAIDWLEQFYDCNSDTELIGASVPATEHSVMCLGGQETELETYRRLITEVYPKGIVSIVSDTWNYWDVLTKTLPALRQQIMERDGKLVIRPDSGDPAKIILGDPTYYHGSPYFTGTMKLLFKEFGGSKNSKGYIDLNPHLGVIYGDSITLDKCREICEGLKRQGFSSTNMVYGIGSYTYQYVTRDTFGFAMKATYGVVDGKPLEIYKDPLTDGGVKKSAKGLLHVTSDLKLVECCTEEQEKGGMLRTVFMDGKECNSTTLSEIRNKLWA